MALSTTKIHHKSKLKQQNKKHHNLGHKSNRQVLQSNKGRVSSCSSIISLCSTKNKELKREERRNQAKQIRANKREETIYSKRKLGTDTSPPFLVSVVPLSFNIDPKNLINSLTNLDHSSTAKFSDLGIAHLSCTRLKQRFSFAIAPVGDLYANLDLAKGSDTILFVWKLGEELISSFEMIVSNLFLQGYHSVLHAVVGEEDIPNKAYAHGDLDLALKNSLVISEQRSEMSHKKIRLLKELQADISSIFPGHFRLFFLDKIQEVNLLLRQVGCQKQKGIFYKDERAHIVAENLDFEGEGSTGTLKIQGYIRSQPLSVNSLVHIPGWGEFQLSQMDLISDPFPLHTKKHLQMSQEDSEPKVLDVPDPRLQESLESTYENDLMEDDLISLTADDQTEDLLSMKEPKKKRRAPKGVSSYQSSWLVDLSDDESDEEKEEMAWDNFDTGDDLHPAIPFSKQSNEDDQSVTSAGADDEIDNREENDNKSIPTTIDDDYDNYVDYDEEKQFLNKLKAAREDAKFPDEIDTPHDIPSKIRFQKYRGLESFHKSKWVDKTFPLEYGKIFDTRNFFHLKKRILKRERDGALPGWYVMLHVKDVPRHLYVDFIKNQTPLVVFSLLPFEQKMTVVHAVVKSHSSGHIYPIKSKERLIFHVGFRRFTNCPIFSEHSTGDKHKFLRYFQPGETVVATMYAPVTFPPCPIMVYKMSPNGDHELVATGSLGYPRSKRIILKKIVLSGHPYKISTRRSIIRYMFFNREDILFFKKIKLQTKLGLQGEIEEPVGTHGHMKCIFKGQLKSSDTVLMNLYKRVFPKWTYDSYVPRPLSPLEKEQAVREIGKEGSSLFDADQEQKSKKRVKFFDE